MSLIWQLTFSRFFRASLLLFGFLFVYFITVKPCLRGVLLVDVLTVERRRLACISGRNHLTTGYGRMRSEIPDQISSIHRHTPFYAVLTSWSRHLSHSQCSQEPWGWSGNHCSKRMQFQQFLRQEKIRAKKSKEVPSGKERQIEWVQLTFARLYNQSGGTLGKRPIKMAKFIFQRPGPSARNLTVITHARRKKYSPFLTRSETWWLDTSWGVGHRRFALVDVFLWNLTRYF